MRPMSQTEGKNTSANGAGDRARCSRQDHGRVPLRLFAQVTNEPAQRQYNEGREYNQQEQRRQAQLPAQFLIQLVHCAQKWQREGVRGRKRLSFDGGQTSRINSLPGGSRNWFSMSSMQGSPKATPCEPVGCTRLVSWSDWPRPHRQMQAA